MLFNMSSFGLQVHTKSLLIKFAGDAKIGGGVNDDEDRGVRGWLAPLRGGRDSVPP